MKVDTKKITQIISQKTPEPKYGFHYSIKPTNFLILPEDKQQKKLNDFFTLLMSIKQELQITLTRSSISVIYKTKPRIMQVLEVLLDSKEPLDDTLEKLEIKFTRDESHYQLKVSEETKSSFTTYLKDEKIIGRAYTLEEMPSQLPDAWIHKLFEGFHRIQILITPIVGDKAGKIIRNKKAIYNQKKIETEKDIKRINDISSLEKSIELGLTKLFSITVNGFIFADNHKELNKLEKETQSIMSRINVSMIDSYGQQENFVNGGGISWFGNVESTSIFYPFVSADMLEVPNGVVLGINRGSNEKTPVIYDPKNRKNHNIFICGGMGSGKSFSGKIMLKRFQEKHPNIFCVVIDPQEEYLPHAEYFGLEPVKIKVGNEYGLNPFNLFEEKSQVIDILAAFTEAPIKTVKHWRSICEGITSIKDLYKKSDDDGKEYLVDLVKGPIAKMFEGETKFSDRMIIGLKETENQEIEKLLILLVLMWAWKRINDLPSTQWKQLVLEEAWRMTKLKESGQRVAEITREIRKRSGIFTVITQQFTDLDKVLDGESKITDLFDTKIVMQLGNTAAKGVGKALDLTEYEVDKIKNFNKGEGLMFTSDNTIFIKFESTEKELTHYFNTDEEKE